MDFSTIVGLITGVAMIIIAIIDSGGGVDIFTSGSAYLIVIGGTLAATFVNFPFKAVISSFKSATNVFSSEEIQEIYLIDEIVNLGKIKREKGVFGLEKEMKNIQNPFLKNAIELSLGGDKKERLESHLMLELKNSEKRDNNATEIFYQMGEYAPAFGMIGTVIGLAAGRVAGELGRPLFGIVVSVFRTPMWSYVAIGLLAGYRHFLRYRRRESWT